MKTIIDDRRLEIGIKLTYVGQIARGGKSETGTCARGHVVRHVLINQLEIC